MEQWKKSIYTDLAVEERESFPGDGGETLARADYVDDHDPALRSA